MFIYVYISCSMQSFLVRQKMGMFKKTPENMISFAAIPIILRTAERNKGLIFGCRDSLHNQNVDEIHQNQGESFPPAKEDECHRE